MRRARLLVLGVAMVATASVSSREAQAQSYNFSFSGPGVWGSIMLSYGSATDAKYPNAHEITGISGSFSDTNHGLNIVNAPIGSLLTVNHATSTDPLLPNDFSRYAVASGLSDQANGFITYDNLFWPGGSVAVCSDYPFFGGFLDVYGLGFNIGNGQVVNFWSNGATPPNGVVDYGLSVSTAATNLDYVGAAVTTTTPEPSSLTLLGTGLVGLVGVARRKARV